MRKISALPLEQVKITGGFWEAKQSLNREKTIPAIQVQLQKTGRIDAWYQDKSRDNRNTRSVIHKFYDSDLAKWLEAVAYSLQNHPDPALEKEADELIELIAKAQQADGYLNSYFTTFEPEKRWTNLRDWHEMYNAGHLIEAAVAYYQATGKRQLLDVLSRYADHIGTIFGAREEQKHGYPGHPELEMALVRLYHATGEKRYLELSEYFINERGKEPHYFDLEAKARGEDPKDFWFKNYRYCQAHEPLRQQTFATGHAVRACYLYAGLADIALETGDAELLELSRRLWDDLTSHQMYITGGLGPAHSNEGFTFAYDLPNETAYAETCAGISLIFWAQRMFQLDPDGRYIDVLERALYNNVLSGVSLEGDTFFYANPLSSFPYVNPFEHLSGITSAQHYRREEWFACPCCPPNLARLVASLGAYCYSTSETALYVHLYTSSTADFQMGSSAVQIEQSTNYPWDGQIQLKLNPAQAVKFDLALHLPEWARAYSLELNGKRLSAHAQKGYLHIEREWSAGDMVTLNLEMPVERIVPNPEIRHNAGQIALQRGPLIYCLEEVDNGAQLANLIIPPTSRLSASYDANVLGGTIVITGEAQRLEPENWQGGLYQSQALSKTRRIPVEFTAIPYFSWANRAGGEMRVWLREA